MCGGVGGEGGKAEQAARPLAVTQGPEPAVHVPRSKGRGLPCQHCRPALPGCSSRLATLSVAQAPRSHAPLSALPGGRKFM